MAQRQRSHSPRSSSAQQNYLFVGNPGVGKSSIINGLIGEPVFIAKSSTSGGGVTYKFDKKVIPGKGVFMDTPGLSDEKMRKKAAESITEALKQNGFYRIFFVLTVEAGRVRPDDKTTMKLVLDSAPTITNYSVIINKVSKVWATEIQEPENAKNWVTTLMDGLPKVTTNIHFMHRQDELDDRPNVKYDAPEDVIVFVNNAPGMMIMSKDVSDVQHDQFAAMEKKHAEALDKLRADGEAGRKAMQEAADQQKSQFERAFAEQREAMKKSEEKGQETISALNTSVDQANKAATDAQNEARRARESQSGGDNIFGLIGKALGTMFGM